MNTNTNINAFAACDLSASRESCLTGVYASLKDARSARIAHLSTLAEAGMLDRQAVGFAAFLSGFQAIGDILRLSSELVGARAL